MNRHVKLWGYVSEVHGDRWWGIIQTDVCDVIAEMREPLPEGMREGNLFTIHTTKRGHTYLYWIRTPVTKNQIKRARIEGRARSRSLFRAFHDAATA